MEHPHLLTCEESEEAPVLPQMAEEIQDLHSAA